MHHPFTTPTGDFADPGAMRSRGYDIVLDGTEIGGGSIRIHRPEVQQEVFRVLGISEQEARGALRLPARGAALRRAAARRLALGLDRIAAIIAGRESIRDVIAFPKTASGADPLTGAPAPVDHGAARGARAAARPGRDAHLIGNHPKDARRVCR